MESQIDVDSTAHIALGVKMHIRLPLIAAFSRAWLMSRAATAVALFLNEVTGIAHFALVLLLPLRI